MASIIAGYQYDIFISYRQKDNKYDGWVTEFVNNLNRELEATFKEEISLYFDINPHDGILETHDVEASLNDKLKCIILIPVISRTYCDPKSYAWEYEFCAFNIFSKGDNFGRDIKLPNGNVACRILPVKIHEIDNEDKELIEKQLGSPLRAIEFIYKEAGVNRPLKPGDRKDENINRTDYRNQINKTANAIKEIIDGMQKPNHPGKAGIKEKHDETGYPKSKNYNSIAVLPFANMSNDREQEYFSDGITEEIINVLVKIPDLKVAGRTSSFSFKGKNEDIRTIGEKLGVNTVLEGSVRSSGNRIRITAQLIDVQNGFHMWSEKYDRELKDIFDVQDEISLAIANELKVRIFEQNGNPVTKAGTQNVEAYRYYLKGKYFWHNNRSKEGIEEAIRNFRLATEYDPEYALAYTGMANAYVVLGNWGFLEPVVAVDIIKDFVNKSKALDPTLAENHIPLLFNYSFFEFKWSESEAEATEALSINPRIPEAHHFYAISLMCFCKTELAIRHNTIARELDPYSIIFNFAYGLILYLSHRYDEAIRQFSKTLVLDNTFTAAHQWSSMAYIKKELYAEAVNELRKMMSKDPEKKFYSDNLNSIFQNSGITGVLSWLTGDGINIFPGIYNYPYQLAVFHSLLKNKDDAFRLIDKAIDNHVSFIAWLKTDPGFENLHDDQRFTDALHRINLS